MNKNELKEGEIYKAEYNCKSYIIKVKIGLENCINLEVGFNNLYKYGVFKDNGFKFSSATPEEKHWLETCIKLDKFVYKEEAMKSFTKEVIKVKPFDVLSFKGIGDHNKGLFNKEDSLYRFELSNSSYTIENLLANSEYVIINSVINEEGNIFMIDDTITTLEGVNKGKSFTITGFRLNKSKTMICAITNIHSNGVGIDKIEHFIEKEIVIEETLLEKAKRLYPVGTKFNAARGNRSTYTVLHQSIFRERGDGAICIQDSGNGTIYFNNVWAEIIEDVKVGDVKVGDKFKFKQHDHGEFIIDKIQDSTDGKIIFYNQHEKYNKNHNRVLLKNITIIK